MARARICVVLSNMPELLRDIVVDAVSAEPDIEIVGEARSVDELERFLEQRIADLVIAAERDANFARDGYRLLVTRAPPFFLVLTESGSAAYLHWLKPETSALGQLTPDSLVSEIRAAACSHDLPGEG